MKKKTTIIAAVALALLSGWVLFRYINRSAFNPNSKYTIGQPLDSFNGVKVYYNGMVGHTSERNLTDSGYNLGMKYQCVEFVKRYYYQRFNHKMPDSYGNAKDFFDAALPDSSLNPKRGLFQFTNGSRCKPMPEDLIIFDGHAGNPYGHVAIIASTSDTDITIIQQNPGPFAPSRVGFGLKYSNGRWFVNAPRVLGWLRKDTTTAVVK